MSQQLMQMLTMLNNSGNPQMMLNQMAQNNPTLQRAMQMVQGKSDQEIQAIVLNLARQQGITDEQLGNLMKSVGFKL